MPPCCCTGETYYIWPDPPTKFSTRRWEQTNAFKEKVQELVAAIEQREPGFQSAPQLCGRKLPCAKPLDAVVLSPTRVYLAWYEYVVADNRCVVGGRTGCDIAGRIAPAEAVVRCLVSSLPVASPMLSQAPCSPYPPVSFAGTSCASRVTLR